MPTAPTYPGVYIEEIPSGVHTITGVATSITAFVGRAERGPINEATRLTSFADFERLFGGLNGTFPLSYLVHDFFGNGGTQAIIVRLFKGANPPASTAADNGLTLTARSKGAWGSNLFYLCDQIGIAAASEYFNLRIYELVPAIDPNKPVLREVIGNVSVQSTSRRRIDNVLRSESLLVDATIANGATKPTIKVPGTDNPVAFATKGDDGTALTLSDDVTGSESNKTGLHALDKVELFNLLCIAPDNLDTDFAAAELLKLNSAAAQYCASRRSMFIMEPPLAWHSTATLTTLLGDPRTSVNALVNQSPDLRNAAVFFPRVMVADSSSPTGQRIAPLSGVIAGVMAKTDATRGVWKAPAGMDAGIAGISGLGVKLNDRENGLLNPIGINCLRYFTAGGNVVWGSRTLRGDDQLADEYKYIPVRRTALFIEESLYRGTQWAVFEPNDEPLWSQLRLNIGAFMNDMFRQGAFQGRTPREAYFVKCDKETTTQSDINKGIVNVVVGFAPLKPAEFVVIKLQQIAGQIDT